MARIKLSLPDNMKQVCSLPVRITEINYGGHLGNDRILALAQEARVLWLAQYGYGELQIEGLGLIMADAAIEFKSEVFYGDTLEVWMGTAGASAVSFDLYYELRKKTAQGYQVAALVKTGMVCFDYQRKKPALIPAAVREKLQLD
jgi:acyl-CoA thioester hydrolase